MVMLLLFAPITRAIGGRTDIMSVSHVFAPITGAIGLTITK